MANDPNGNTNHANYLDFINPEIQGGVSFQGSNVHPAPGCHQEHYETHVSRSVYGPPTSATDLPILNSEITRYNPHNYDSKFSEYHRNEQIVYPNSPAGYGLLEGYPAFNLHRQPPIDSSPQTLSSVDTEIFHVVKARDQRRWFRPGKVFGTYTIKFHGHSDMKSGRSMTSQEASTRPTYKKLQFFVVTKRFDKYSQCIPINTYNGNATSKPHVKSSHHSVIYSTTEVPKLLPGERARDLKKPIKVDVEKGRKHLLPESRLCYSRIETVEHNVPVYKIGKLSDNELTKVLAGVREVKKSTANARQDDSDDDDDVDDSEGHGTENMITKAGSSSEQHLTMDYDCDPGLFNMPTNFVANDYDIHDTGSPNHGLLEYTIPDAYQIKSAR